MWYLSKINVGGSEKSEDLSDQILNWGDWNLVCCMQRNDTNCKVINLNFISEEYLSIMNEFEMAKDLLLNILLWYLFHQLGGFWNVIFLDITKSNIMKGGWELLETFVFKLTFTKLSPWHFYKIANCKSTSFIIHSKNISI